MKVVELPDESHETMMLGANGSALLAELLASALAGEGPLQ